MRSKYFVMLALIASLRVDAGQAGDKRVILTSGESVHTIRYKLGQSTIIYLGSKPETVICGNKNYFNIEKIKEGVTIQPLGNFSTNLSILDRDRRYLFYLTPALGLTADTFVDVKWISTADLRPVEKISDAKSVRVSEIGQKIQVAKGVELAIERQKLIDGEKRQILDLELSVSSPVINVGTKEIEVLAMKGKAAYPAQTLVWEGPIATAKRPLRGRIIIADAKLQGAQLLVRFGGREIRTTIKRIIY